MCVISATQGLLWNHPGIRTEHTLLWHHQPWTDWHMMWVSGPVCCHEVSPELCSADWGPVLALLCFIFLRPFFICSPRSSWRLSVLGMCHHDGGRLGGGHSPVNLHPRPYSTGAWGSPVSCEISGSGVRSAHSALVVTTVLSPEEQRGGRLGTCPQSFHLG